MNADSTGGLRQALLSAAVAAKTAEDRIGWPVTHRERFYAIYDDVMDALAESAESRGTTVDRVRSAYCAIVAGDPHITPHDEVMARTGLGYHDARQAAAVLSDIGDVHECYDPGWNLQWVRCDNYIHRKCEERRISLHRYFVMREELAEFQDKVVGWYVRRNRRQAQPFNLRELKEEYVHRLQERYFPDKPVGDEWSRHIAARYLRTAQDVMIRAYNLTY